MQPSIRCDQALFETSLLYPDKANRGGGWPMESPNSNARDPSLANRLYEESLSLVGLEG